MTTKTVSIVDSSIHSQEHQTYVGDMLIHSEKKIIVLPVILHSSTDKITTATTTAIPAEKPIVYRLAPNRSPVHAGSSTLGGDLKNNFAIKSTVERTKTFSSKNVLRVHKAGWALVKELKSRVLTGRSDEENFYTVTQDESSEQTHF